VSILDLLFPKICVGCGFVGEVICLKCINLLKTKRSHCFYCEKASLFGITHPSCLKKGPIDGSLILYQYSGLMVKIIRSYKYQLNQTIIDRFLLEAVLTQISKIKEFMPKVKVLLVPVPLGAERMRRRGFNQSLVICKYLSRLLGLEVADVLIKNRKTPPQAGISNKIKRKINMRKAFSIKNKQLIKNKDVMIVDDLVTTGATINELGGVLKNAGSGRIYSFALARP